MGVTTKVHMNTERYGIILNVERYDECVSFYRDALGLDVMFSKVEGDLYPC
jgi:lactoylglutathione lyase